MHLKGFFSPSGLRYFQDTLLSPDALSGTLVAWKNEYSILKN